MHSEEYSKAGKSREAHDAVILGAKILAASAFDILDSPEVLKEIRKEFERNKAVFLET